MLARWSSRPGSSLAVALTLALTLQADTALAQNEAQNEDTPLYPQIVDVSHASDEVAEFFASFFTAKSLHDLDGTMSHFSPGMVTYTEAVLGWPLDSFEILENIFAQYMPTWPDAGLSYPTRILGDMGSALVAFTDTPELFGGELRIMSAINLEDGKIVRWVDYWDSTSFDTDLYLEIRTPDDSFPTDFKETAVGETASQRIRTVSTQLQSAFANADAEAAAGLFTYDAVYEDMVLHAQLLGRSEIQAYLSRVLRKAPFGEGSVLRHVVGSDLGGGFEWIGSPMTSVRFGITALELDPEGMVSRLTTVYDGRLLGDAEIQDLVTLAVSR